VVSTPPGPLENFRDAISESRQKLGQTGLKDGKCRCGVHMLFSPRLCVCMFVTVCVSVCTLCVFVCIWVYVYHCLCMYMYVCMYNCVYMCACVSVYMNL